MILSLHTEQRFLFRKLCMEIRQSTNIIIYQTKEKLLLCDINCESVWNICILMVFAKAQKCIEYKFLVEIFLLRSYVISLNISPLLLILYICTCSKHAAFEYGKVFDICIFSLRENIINLREERELKNLYRVSICSEFRL